MNHFKDFLTDCSMYAERPPRFGRSPRQQSHRPSNQSFQRPPIRPNYRSPPPQWGAVDGTYRDPPNPHYYPGQPPYPPYPSHGHTGYPPSWQHQGTFGAPPVFHPNWQTYGSTWSEKDENYYSAESERPASSFVDTRFVQQAKVESEND